MSGWYVASWKAKGRRGFFLSGGGGVGGLNFHIGILEIQMQSKNPGGGWGGVVWCGKKASIGNFLLVDCAIGMVILKEGDLYELQ